MVKVFIDAGHGGTDSGASANGIKEKDIVLKIAKKVQSYLQDYNDVSIKMSRTTDVYLSLKQRTDMANAWGADYFLSIHVNAGGGTGFESFVYSTISDTSKTNSIRNQIHDEIMKVIGMRDRGKKKANLHVLRESKMASCLTENGFIDTKADADQMKSSAWIDKVGKAHAVGIAKAFGLKKKTSSGDGTSGTYKLTKDTAGYVTAADAKANRNQMTTVKAGTYYIYKSHDGMLNLSITKGSPGSWINPGSSGGSGTKTYKVGDKVRIKSTAKTYATGETIPSYVKGESYTIQQLKSDRVLLSGIMSWVRKSDLA